MLNGRLETSITVSFLVFALYTLIHHIAVAAGLSLRASTLFFLLGVLGTLGAVSYAYREGWPMPFSWRWRPEPGVRGTMWLVSLTGAAIGMLFGFVLPDDAGRVGTAVHHYHASHLPVSLDLPLATVGPAVMPWREALYSHTHFVVSISWLLGISPNVILFYLGPAMLGAGIPAVWYLFLRRLTNVERSAVSATLVVWFLILLDGAGLLSGGTYGGFRFWDGRSVMAAIGLPLMAALAIDFVRAPRFAHWIFAGAMSVCAAGFVPTQALAVPIFLTLVATVTAWVDKRALPVRRLFILFGVTALYPTGAAVMSGVGVTPDVAAGIDYWLGQLTHTFGWPVGPIVLAAGLSGAFLAWSREWPVVIWIGAWTAGLIVFSLVEAVLGLPLSGGGFASDGRLLLLALPLLPLAGLGVMLGREEAIGRRVVQACSLALFVAVCVTWGLRVWPAPVADERVIGFQFGPKATQDTLKTVSSLSGLPEGASILAPSEISAWLAILDGRFRLVGIDGERVARALVPRGRDLEARNIARSIEFVSGEDASDTAFWGFRKLLATAQIDHVLIRWDVVQRPEVVQWLVSHNYRVDTSINAPVAVYSLTK